MCCVTLQSHVAVLAYYADFSRLIKKYVKGHVTVWGSKAELSRVVAFTCLQAVVKKIPTFLEELLKAMYVEYTKCSKQMNPKTRDHVVLMRNCLVEMFKINPSITYTTGFLYIRQLAVTLRSAIISNKDTETVYNWQFINCVHVWVCVLADCDACLQPLVFPLIQVMMGVIKLHNSPCFFPLHLHTIRMLLFLAEATNKHIPLIHPLLNVLEFCASAHKTQATKPIDLTCVLRVTKGYKKTKAYQDAIFDLTYELLLNYTAQLSGSIAFPEVTFPLTVWLKKFNKKCNSAKFTGQIKQILDKTEVVSRDITERRSAVEFTPKDLDKVAEWENRLPQSALAKYLNSWLKVHRTALAAAAASAPEEDSDEEAGEAEEDDSEDEKPAKKKGKKAKKGGSSEKDEKTKKSKKKTAKTETTTDVIETAEFVDDGDLVEDFVMSD